MAGFVRALKDIDGVTRVGLESSELGEQEEQTSEEVTSDSASTGSTTDCQTKSFIAKFNITVAFDAAPIAATLEEEGSVAPATPPPPAEGSGSGSTEASSSSSTTETTSTESTGAGE